MRCGTHAAPHIPVLIPQAPLSLRTKAKETY